MAYATRTQLGQFGIRAAALAGIPTGDQDAALEAASDLADSYLRSRFTLPLTVWQDDLRRAVCSIAAYDLLSSRGYNPDAGADTNVRQRYEDAIRWLERVAAGQVTPDVTDSGSGGDEGNGSAAGAARVFSSEPRGW